MDLNPRRLAIGGAVVVVALILVAWWAGWFGGRSPTPAQTAVVPQPIVATAPATPAKPAGAPCVVPPDVLPVAAGTGAAATVTPVGPSADGNAAWVVSGLIFRCGETGSFSLDIATPPELGLTASAGLQMSITGVTFSPESEAAENKPTAWGLVSAPTIAVKDTGNTDAGKNVLTIGWKTDLSRIVAYEMAYTIYLSQKK